MVDIARLGFEVETSGLVKGKTALEALGAAGEKTKRSSVELGEATEKNTRAFEEQRTALERQRILLTEGADAARRFDLAIEGATDSEIDLLESIRRANLELEKSGKHTDGMVAGFGRLGPMAAAVGSAIAAMGLGEVAGFMVNSYRETEKYTMILKTATGSLGAANAELMRLREYAETTPYSLAQAVDGYVKLKDLGLDPSIEAMKSYGNTSTAMGKDYLQMVEAVADAATFQYERLLEFGIKAETSGDKVKFTFQGVTTEIEKDSKAIEQYLQNIGKVNFAGAMTDQMNTLNGVISNLEDSAASLSATFMEQSGAATALKNSLKYLSDAFGNLDDYMRKDAATPASLAQNTWNGDSSAAIGQMTALTQEFKTASQERRAAIRDEMMDFYEALKTKRDEYVAAIQSASNWTEVPGLSAYAEAVATADGNRLAATQTAINAVEQAFRETGTAVESLGESQRPIWETMVSGAKSAAAAVRELSEASNGVSSGANWLPSTEKYSDIINEAASKFKIDPKLIKSVMAQESSGNPNAVSSKGATGLMQLMPATGQKVADDIGIKGYSALNPRDNIMAGAAYLSQQYYKYGKDIEKTLAAYNAGPGAVDKYGGVPPYKETQNYVAKIMASYRELTGEAEKSRNQEAARAKQEANNREQEARRLASENKRVADEKQREADKLADSERQAIEENFQLAMERVMELNAAKLELSKVGMSKTEALGADLKAQGYSPDEIQQRVAVAQETTYAGMKQQLVDLYSQATMTNDEYQRFILLHREGLTPAMVETIEQMGKEVQAAQEVKDLFSGWSDVINGELADSLKQLVHTGDELLDQLIAKLIEAIVTSQTLEASVNASGSAGGGVGGGIVNAFTSLFGFAGGGSFTVGGSGGTDTSLVAFRATPGERVTVATPAQQDSQQGGVSLNLVPAPQQRSGSVSVVVTNQGQPVKAEARATERDGQLQIEVLLEQIEARQARGIRSGGSPVDVAIQETYGLRRSNY